MFWSNEVGGTSKCPECKEQLEPDPHAYLMMFRSKSSTKPFIVGPRGGYFCPRCPSVVLDKEAFNDYAYVVSGMNDGKFVVLGIIDYDALPADKRHLQFGKDDEIPLVSFTNLVKKRKKSGRSRRRLRPKRR